MSKRYVRSLRIFPLFLHSFVSSIFTFVQIIRGSAFGWHPICFALTNGQHWLRGEDNASKCGCYPSCNFMVRLELHIHNIKLGNSRKWRTNAKNDDNEYSRFSTEMDQYETYHLPIHITYAHNDIKAGY